VSQVARQFENRGDKRRIHQRQFCIDIDGDAVARLVDYLPQVVNQRRKAVVVYGYVVVHGVSDIVRLDYARVSPSLLFCFAKLRQFSDMAKFILEVGMAG
jgi:predicted transcriptional regulator